MSLINKIKINYNKAKTATKRGIKTTKDTIEFTKDSINTIKEAKKLYNEFTGNDNASKAKPANKTPKTKKDTDPTNNGPVIDVDFEEIK